MEFKNTLDFAQKLDFADSLNHFRNKFLFPKHNGKNALYFTGNSLGLQPVTAKQFLLNELADWEKYGVEGHFKASNPWFSYHEMFAQPLATIVGANTNEVVAMNGLTTNIHLLLASFYNPTGKRNKIICEAKAFPSDQYALETHIKQRGLNPDKIIIEVSPNKGEHCISNDKIIETIEKHNDEVALVFIGGVNYYTGQVFNMQAITQAAHKVGALAGFDLAHAVGNISLQLNKWNVDFAAWCSYKYLNSGPGSVSGVYINHKHTQNKQIPRFGGWWGHNKKTRFLMEKGFDPILTAEAWQLSNAPVFSMAVHKASLNIFIEAGFENLVEKSKKLTAYLEFIIQQVSNDSQSVNFEIITPHISVGRGAQLSILCHGGGKKLFDSLTQKGVFADWREPNVIRLAPVPLYNSFQDIYEFGVCLKESI